jgi:PKD repeat protein
VTFTSAGATATHWDFGDGSTADRASVSHAFGASGAFTVKVTSTDAVGNATTATRTIQVTTQGAPGGGTITVAPPPPGTVKPCNVPSLKGLTKAKAKAKLKARHCALGKTITPKKLRKTKGLVVVKQSRKAGTVTKAVAKVNVTLGTKPKAGRR